jgi:hypothetical protein
MLSFLGEFVKLQKATISFVMSVHPSVSAPNKRIFIKFYIRVFFSKSVEKIKVSFKSKKNNGHFI